MSYSRTAHHGPALDLSAFSHRLESMEHQRLLTKEADGCIREYIGFMRRQVEVLITEHTIIVRRITQIRISMRIVSEHTLHPTDYSQIEQERINPMENLQEQLLMKRPRLIDEPMLALANPDEQHETDPYANSYKNH